MTYIKKYGIIYYKENGAILEMKNIYIDGASHPHTDKSGGFGVVILEENNELIYAYSEYAKDTTNNREELKAMIHALEYIIDHKNQEYTIYCDSIYTLKSLTEWMSNWTSNGWKNSKKEPVANQDLMSILWNYWNQYFCFPNVTFTHIRGHRGILGNELADALASKNKKKFSDLITSHNVKINNIDL